MTTKLFQKEFDIMKAQKKEFLGGEVFTESCPSPIQMPYRISLTLQLCYKALWRIAEDIKHINLKIL